MGNLVIVGAGRLGCRYLQSFAARFGGSTIWVVDPSGESLSRAAESVVGVSGVTIRYLPTCEGLPREAELAVVATTSNVRLDAMRQVAERVEVPKMILEKVLFQRIGEYDEAAALLEGKGISAWVNCIRRSYSFYADLSEFLGAGDARISARVEGGDWGLACNAVHFLDLLSFLARSPLALTDCSGIIGDWHESKRAGFKELYGVLRGECEDGSAIELVSSKDLGGRLLVGLRAGDRAAFVDEGGGRMFLSAPGKDWESAVIRPPMASEAMGGIAADAIERGECALPRYDDAARTHLAFLAGLESRFGGDSFPIT